MNGSCPTNISAPYISPLMTIGTPQHQFSLKRANVELIRDSAITPSMISLTFAEVVFPLANMLSRTGLAAAEKLIVGTQPDSDQRAELFT